MTSILVSAAVFFGFLWTFGTCQERMKICNSQEFMCANNQCIPAKWRCDNDSDCTDRSDEQNCPSRFACNSTQFFCSPYERCFPKSWICDGERDCPDGSDENACTPAFGICQRPTHWACTDGKCIPQMLMCDGFADCPDGSDEFNCSHSCEAGEFQCLNVTGLNMTGLNMIGPQNMTNQICLPVALLCNGMADCDNGWDELLCPNQSNTVADCPSGYQLSKNNKTCVDVDECSDEVNRVCSQICVNFVGGYHCECFENFVLEDNGKTCRAIGSPLRLPFENGKKQKFDLLYQLYKMFMNDKETK